MSALGEDVILMEESTESVPLISRVWFQVWIFSLLVGVMFAVVIGVSLYYFVRKQVAALRKELSPPTETFFWKPFGKLCCSVAIDFIGSVFTLLPVVGQIAGLAWAPLSGALIYMLYRDVSLGTVGLLEEIVPIPLLGAIPTATFSWLRSYWKLPVFWVYSLLTHFSVRKGSSKTS